MNKIIEELYDKIDAQDKIINEQVLEIARLKEEKAKVIEYIKNKLSSLNMNKSAIMRIVEPSNGYLLADVNYEIQKWERLLEILEAKDE